ncbi:MAG: hypothetical protein VB144_02460 [Clostridia bacterium]|nr:hypothetical protein [Clostridia bacterium]
MIVRTYVLMIPSCQKVLEVSVMVEPDRTGEAIAQCAAELERLGEIMLREGESEARSIEDAIISVLDELDALAVAPDIAWPEYRSVRDLQDEARFLLGANRRHRRHCRLAQLEAELLAHTSSEGWRSYLSIEELVSEEMAGLRRSRCARCQASCGVSGVGMG